MAVLIGELRAFGEPVARLAGPYAEIGRDPDDYVLLAHAVVAQVDYLVSRDRDLLDLGEVDDLTITDPPRLLAALRAAGLM